MHLINYIEQWVAKCTPMGL